MTRLSLKLFVSGRSMRSDAAISNLELTLSQIGIDDFDLLIIDVLANPQAAEDEFILATPTLVKVTPEPERRTIGDLSDKALLLRGLDLSPAVYLRDLNEA